ncbi:MAG: AbrB/MazE/SpoVT family DNA-binding domain-containing protein [Candidatus Asgardarchaeia archaeon]
MIITAKGYVGKKEEIYIEKRARKKVGLKPGDRLIVIVRENELVLRKIPNINELLEKKTLAVIDDEEIERISSSVQREYNA